MAGLIMGEVPLLVAVVLLLVDAVAETETKKQMEMKSAVRTVMMLTEDEDPLTESVVLLVGDEDLLAQGAVPEMTTMK